MIVVAYRMADGSKGLIKVATDDGFDAQFQASNYLLSQNGKLPKVMLYGVPTPAELHDGIASK